MAKLKVYKIMTKRIICKKDYDKNKINCKESFSVSN